MVYTAEDLIESVRNQGMIPNSGTTGSKDADILLHLNEAVSLQLLPELVRLRQEYLVVTTRIPIAGTVLKYRLPARAAGDTLRAIRYVASDGSVDPAPLAEIIPERQGDYTWTSAGRPSGWYLENNWICLVGQTVSGSLEISWFFRPGTLVKSNEARQVLAVDMVARTVDSATAFPNSWSTGGIFDVHSFKSGAEIKVWDAVITDLTTSPPYRLTFSASNPIDGSSRGTHPVDLGDWICLAGEAAIPALPMEMHPLLAEAGNIRVMAALGLPQAVAMHNTLMEKAQVLVMGMLQKRVESHARRILGRRGPLWKQGHGW
jgi:hypothetical protein